MEDKNAEELGPVRLPSWLAMSSASHRGCGQPVDNCGIGIPDDTSAGADSDRLLVSTLRASFFTSSGLSYTQRKNHLNAADKSHAQFVQDVTRHVAFITSTASPKDCRNLRTWLPLAPRTPVECAVLMF